MDVFVQFLESMHKKNPTVERPYQLVKQLLVLDNMAFYDMRIYLNIKQA